MSNVFGTPKFGTGGGEFKKTRTVGAGDTAFRALPPMFSQRETGEWRKYYRTHWGYEEAGTHDPSRKFQKPFRCIHEEDRRTGLVKQECPACKKEEQVQAERAQREKEIRAQMVGKEESVILAVLAKDKEIERLDQWLDDHRADGKWFINAMFKDGTFGSIKLNHKFHMNRILEIINGNPKATPPVPSLLEDEGINPLDPSQGVWFVVHRTGTKRNVVDTIDVERENVPTEVNGQKRITKMTVLVPLTEAQCEQAGKECEDLAGLGGADLTYDEIEALVNGTAADEGNSAAVAAKQAEQLAAAVAAKKAAEQEVQKATPAPEPKPEPQPESKPETKAQDPAVVAAQKEAIKKRLAEITARQEAEAKKKAEEEAARKAAEAAAAAAEPAPAVDIASMSDADFLRDFGPGAETL